MVQSHVGRLIAGATVGTSLIAFSVAITSSAQASTAAVRPAVADYAQLTASVTPPSQAQCAAVNRTCFTPQAIQASYNVGPLHTAGVTGKGITIAIVDAYGSDTIAHDLHVFDSAFHLAPMCGEEAVTCRTGMPRFSQLALQGNPATKAPPSQSHGTGQEDKSAWALEVALDVETAHAIAPGADILLVTTPTAETQGVQGLPQMMAAEQYVVDHHLAQVISQSFGTTEEAFGSSQSLLNLRHAFISAAQHNVTVLASSGDGGSANSKKTPVKNPSTVPYPTVIWPASDPLVTSVGGTNLCTDPTAATRTAYVAGNPVAACNAYPGQAEVAWAGSGGGYSHVFGKPGYQNNLPAGSTPIGSRRGVPDVAFQASPRTGALVYVSLPPDGNGSNIKCNGVPCTSSWYDIGGTSLACPQWAGLVALADQLHGGGLGLINPMLYQLAAGSNYGNYFYDVVAGNNATDPSIPGYSATQGWDPVTGLGTPNAANLVPALANGGR